MSTAFTLIENNSHFVIVNKAHNIDFHTIDGTLGIVELVKSQVGFEQLYPVHRLDRMTSGLLVMAKTKQAAAEFGQLFESHNITKYYLALSDKKPKKKQGLIKGDMKKGRNGSYLLLKSNDNPAITQFLSESVSPGLRGYILKPHSGKTHQLRVAMKSIGAPILGDNRYYPNCTAPVGHLHAWHLAFELSGQSYQFTINPAWQHEGVAAWIERLASTSFKWPTL